MLNKVLGKQILKIYIRNKTLVNNYLVTLVKIILLVFIDITC